MFLGERQESCSEEEALEFEKYVTRDLRKKLKRAWWATAVFIATVLALTPFLYGHFLHHYWETIGKYLLILAMGEYLLIVLLWGFVYSSWQSAREGRREMKQMK